LELEGQRLARLAHPSADPLSVRRDLRPHEHQHVQQEVGWKLKHRVVRIVIGGGGKRGGRPPGSRIWARLLLLPPLNRPDLPLLEPGLEALQEVQHRTANWLREQPHPVGLAKRGRDARMSEGSRIVNGSEASAAASVWICASAQELRKKGLVGKSGRPHQGRLPLPVS